MGGGGLVQLPALLLGLGPGTPAVYSLGTNKIAGILGTVTSAVTYYRRVRPDLRTALPMAGFALLGALGGAGLASVIPSSAFKPVVLVALVGVLAYTMRRPTLGETTALRHTGRRHHATAGWWAPSSGSTTVPSARATGSFLVFALVGLLGYGFVQASAQAKIANVATNLGALLIFVPQGVVLWKIGLVMGAANMSVVTSGPAPPSRGVRGSCASSSSWSRRPSSSASAWTCSRACAARTADGSRLSRWRRVRAARGTR